ncbi:MAG: ATP-binding protein [Betaproteobacteria bacterium]|nr:ATP-binding protein [Betaproteobacteria bacterium]
MLDEARRKTNADARDRFVPIFYFLERELADKPREAWPVILESHRSGFVFPPRVANLAKVRDSIDAPTYRERLDAARVVFWEKPPSTLMIMKRVTGTDLVLIMDVAMQRSIRNEAMVMNIVVEALFVAALLLVLVALFWRDMKKLRDAADQIGQGRFNFDLDIGKRSALWPVAASINAMKARISALLKSHADLTNAVSHEFRTPIMRLRFRHELALSSARTEDKDRQLAAMSGAIDQLDDLARELLEYARLDREAPQLDFASIDTQAWLGEVLEEARDLARAESLDIQISAEGRAETIEGDYRYLTRAAGNLLRNAVHYAKSAVRVHVSERDGRRELTVEDDGPGIPVAERERLFEPFARLDESRDRDSGGFGIGLAIVKQIARWHGGTVEIGDSPLGGARVSMSW